MADCKWPEVSAAAADNRYELILSGRYFSARIQDCGGAIDARIFTLSSLNYLNISDTCLADVPSDIGRLTNLCTLVLHSNQIMHLPPTIGELSKLKVLDVSRNKLEDVPDQLRCLTQLTSLNLASNHLQQIPSLADNTKLCVLDLSVNQFQEFPDICQPQLVHLAEVKLNCNKIEVIPSAISALISLKVIDMADNCVTVLPRELADISKLKEINLKGNKLLDKRLLKLVEQCRSKQILDYIRQHCLASSGEAASAGGKGKKSKKGKRIERPDVNQQADSVDVLCHKMQVIHVSDTTPDVRVMNVVKPVRPYIICCIVRGLSFTEESLKKFIQLQTKLHDTVCDKRNAATIGTHDLDLVAPGPLTYTAMPPASFKMQPLMRKKSFTGEELFAQLQHEAADLHKEKERNVYSRIHRYLYLLQGKTLYPVLLDNAECVISFPPITNSDITKLSVSTKSMLVEVTSASAQSVCRQAMDMLLSELLLLGVSADDADGAEFHSLIVEQMKIVDVEGNMKAVYPGRTDLLYNTNNIVVQRL